MSVEINSQGDPSDFAGMTDDELMDNAAMQAGAENALQFLLSRAISRDTVDLMLHGIQEVKQSLRQECDRRGIDLCETDHVGVVPRSEAYLIVCVDRTSTQSHLIFVCDDGYTADINRAKRFTRVEVLERCPNRTERYLELLAYPESQLVTMTIARRVSSFWTHAKADSPIVEVNE